MSLECGPITGRDALTLLCGPLLGTGQGREVYASPLDPTLVVKLETVGERQKFQNHAEWIVWEAVREQPALARWFAPCVAISYAGLWLLQRRTTPVTLAELRKALPRVPACFTDLKVSNWGRLEGRLVCHDYGTAMTTERGLTTRTRRADWWEEA